MSSNYTTDNDRWMAINNHDLSARGRFWTGVLSTGIFCQPGCPARTPLRKNVIFLDSIGDGFRAGLRPCKRCKPLGRDVELDQVLAITGFCKSALKSPQSEAVATYAEAAGLYITTFDELFQRTVGETPQEYAMRAATKPPSHNDPAKPRVSRTKFGDHGAGETIRYDIITSPAGYILIAATPQGICHVRMGGNPDLLREEFLNDFRNSTFQDPDEELQRCVQAARMALGGDAPADIPLDIRGTEFQQRVWQALREIPCGETVTYGELAARIGKPTATRAVASACGANDIAIIIPCHRVIAHDGTLGGFRWGVRAKEALLRLENPDRFGGDAAQLMLSFG